MPHVIIELRMDDDGDKEKYDVAVTASKVAAKYLLTAVLLIAGKRKPVIALQYGDMFHSEEEIMLADDIEA
jgi:hypothetical protein